MGQTNIHGIRHKAKGGGKKWRPSPNDHILEQKPKPRLQNPWTQSVRDALRRKR
jgi:hypothetical protein